MTDHDLLAEMTLPPTHPGEVLDVMVLPALGIDRSDAARRLRMSERDLSSLLSGKGKVDEVMADRIGEMCGNGPGLWLRMQEVFDAWHAYHRPEPGDGSPSLSAGA